MYYSDIVKTIRIFIVFFILVNFGAFAIEKTGFRLNDGLDVNSHVLREYVFDDDYTLSRLDYNAWFFPALELEGGAEFYHAVLNGKLISGFPVSCGTLEDFDWCDMNNVRTPGYAAMYSKHNLVMRNFFQANVETGYKFNIGSVNILPEVGFFYRLLKYEAVDGKGKYEVVDSNGKVVNSIEQTFNGTTLTYEHETSALYIKLRSDYSFLNDFTVGLYGSYSPYLWAKAIDSHYVRNKMFKDRMEGGFGIMVGVDFQWKKLLAFFEYEYEQMYQGKSTSDYLGLGSSGNTTLKTKSGFDSSLFRIGLQFHF